MAEPRRRVRPGVSGVRVSGSAEDASKVTWLRLLGFIVSWVTFIFVFHAYRQDRASAVAGSGVGAPLKPASSSSSSSSSSSISTSLRSEAQAQAQAGLDLGKDMADGVAQSELVLASKISLPALQSKMYYWKLDPLANTGLERLPSMAGDKYVLFRTDCGGFNNIRMAFEYFVFMAWLNRRVLVLPPSEGWYLIDFGPFARMKPEEKGTTTQYNEFFDMEHLRAAVPVISAEEFREREGRRFGLSEDLMQADLKTKSGAKKWQEFIKGATGLDEKDYSSLGWCPLSKVIFYPSITSVEAQYPEGVPKEFVHHRERVEITPEINAKPLMIFPSCKDNQNYRYLGQVAALAAFADEALSRSYKRMLRDNVHYRSIVFDVAARVVHHLGPFAYSALHIRRNDLQYKEVFIDASESLENLRPLLQPREKLYIATDEKSFDTFFRPFTDAGHEIFHWDDFFTDRGGNVLTGVHIPRKLEGCIEQVICALGRFFAGTIESTFSSYIFRLRGYYHAPSTEVYYHNIKYTGKVKQDRAKTYQRKPPKGQIYKSEHPSIWEDAERAHTTW